MTDSEDAQFEAWWESDGQYMRAGGGKYEKTFAYEAWQHQQKRVSELTSALERLADLADRFNVSGVYFHESKENLAALDAAQAALNRA